MQVVVELPDAVAKQLGPHAKLQRRALEAVVVEGHREGRLTSGQVAELLGLGRWEAEDLLDAHGARLRYSLEMLEEDRRTMARLLDR